MAPGISSSGGGRSHHDPKSSTLTEAKPPRSPSDSQLMKVHVDMPMRGTFSTASKHSGQRMRQYISRGPARG